jgi:hypothetical protein
MHAAQHFNDEGTNFRKNLTTPATLTEDKCRVETKLIE